MNPMSVPEDELLFEKKKKKKLAKHKGLKQSVLRQGSHEALGSNDPGQLNTREPYQVIQKWRVCDLDP